MKNHDEKSPMLGEWEMEAKRDEELQARLSPEEYLAHIQRNLDELVASVSGGVPAKKSKVAQPSDTSKIRPEFLIALEKARIKAQKPMTREEFQAAADKVYLKDDVNRPETEADGERAGTLRRLQALHQSEAFRDQTRALSKSQSDTPKAEG